jgi:hypothetical protein
MSEKKPRQNWPQTPLEWLGVLVLVFLAYSAWEAVHNIASPPETESTRAMDEYSRSIEATNRAVEKVKEREARESSQTASIADLEQSLIGKWRYWGSLNHGEDEGLDWTMEFFADGSYSRFAETPGIENPYRAGVYELVDGQLNTTEQSCGNGECETINNAVMVEFPNTNTMYMDNDGLIIVLNREF